jgi:hypothetical protein
MKVLFSWLWMLPPLIIFENIPFFPFLLSLLNYKRLEDRHWIF